MTRQECKRLATELASVTVFRNVIKRPAMEALYAFLRCDDDATAAMRLFGDFVYALEKDNFSFSDFLSRVIYEDENLYVTSRAKKAEIVAPLFANAKAELGFFSRLTTLKAEDLCADVADGCHVPQFANVAIDFEKTYEERLSRIHELGYGVFASNGMFRVECGEIVPVDAADTITQDRFIGYAAEREQVFHNTEALLAGRPAANVLLYGDAGTGKSSTVKACANEFFDRGVRLIELRKDQLFELPNVMGRIAENPLKFILFIDDLSFNKNDDNFSMLKAALEGSASAKASNAVIYATSNRRHIVKETFSDRGTSDDVHHSDTVQELMSLSDRFGLTVYFSRPNKNLYLDIVHKLAEKLGVSMPLEELDVKAEAYALAKGFRSPRAAEQFVNSLLI